MICKHSHTNSQKMVNDFIKNFFQSKMSLYCYGKSGRLKVLNLVMILVIVVSATCGYSQWGLLLYETLRSKRDKRDNNRPYCNLATILCVFNLAYKTVLILQIALEYLHDRVEIFRNLTAGRAPKSLENSIALLAYFLFMNIIGAINILCISEEVKVYGFRYNHNVRLFGILSFIDCRLARFLCITFLHGLCRILTESYRIEMPINPLVKLFGLAIETCVCTITVLVS